MSWADSEFEDAWFGDDRLRQRAIRVCERLAEHPSESIPVACCGRAEVEAAYRFFSNAKVTAARVLAPHHDASIRRLAAHPVVLCDTTELDFTGKQTAGLGPLNYAATNGLYLHVTTALTPQRQALGIVAQEFFVHDPACFGQARKRAIGYYARSIEEKESGRWLRAFESLCEIWCRKRSWFACVTVKPTSMNCWPKRLSKRPINRASST
jgi:Transposase DNA-binding